MSLKPDPLGDPRNPLAIYLLCLCLLSGTLILAGFDASKSIEDSLPQFLVYVWGGTLVFGSVFALTGAYWQGDPRTGLVLKRIGYLTLAVAGLIYSLVLWWSFGLAATFPGGIVLGFSAASGIQYRRVNNRIKRIIEATP